MYPDATRLSAVPTFLLAVAVWTAVSIALLGPEFNAWFWLIDDHEVIRLLGSDLVLPWSDYWSTLAASEAGNPGLLDRYRPIYWFLRITETALWGDRLVIWYGVRMVIFGVFLASLWWAISRAVGLLLASSLTLYVASLSFWQHIWTRITPAEQYTVLGVSILLIGATVGIERWRSKRPPGWSVWLISIGMTIAIGSKETNLFLAPGAVAFAWMLLQRGQLRPHAIVALALPVLTALFVAGAVFVGMRFGSTDFYGNNIWDLGSLVGKPFARVMIAASLLIALSSLVLFQVRRATTNETVRAWSGITLVWVGIGFLFVYVAASQVFFYHGQWPTNGRYDFPGRLIEIGTYVAIVAYLARVADIFSIRRASIKHGVTAVSVVFIVIAALFGFRDMWRAGHDNVDRTTRFQRSILAAGEMVREFPDAPIVLRVTDPTYYELVFSMPHFLRVAGGIGNPIYLSYEPERSPTTFEGLAVLLHQDMERVSRDGGENFPFEGRAIRYPGTWLNKSIGEFTPNAGAPCFEITLRGPPTFDCTQIKVDF